MKKIFLSLSAVALLAVGTVSCGSDDSAPAPVEVSNNINYDGADYDVSTTRGYVYVNQENQMIAYDVDFGGGQTALCTKWAFLVYDGEQFTENTPNFVITEVFIPVAGNSAVYPEDASEMFLASDVEAAVNSVEILSETTNFELNIDNWDSDAEEAKYTQIVNFANGKTLTINYDGFLDAYYGLKQSTNPPAETTTNAKDLVKAMKLSTTKVSGKTFELVK